LPWLVPEAAGGAAGAAGGGTAGSDVCGAGGFVSCPLFVVWVACASVAVLVSCALVGTAGVVAGAGVGLGGPPAGPVWLWFLSPRPQPGRVDDAVSDFVAGALGALLGWESEAVDARAGEVAVVAAGAGADAADAGGDAGDVVGGAGDAAGGEGDAAGGEGDAAGGAGVAAGGEGGICGVCVPSGTNEPRCGAPGASLDGVVAAAAGRLGNAAGNVTRCPRSAGSPAAKTTVGADGAACRLCSPVNGPGLVVNRCSSWCETANAPPTAASSASPSPARTATQYPTVGLSPPMTPFGYRLAAGRPDYLQGRTPGTDRPTPIGGTSPERPTPKRGNFSLYGGGATGPGAGRARERPPA
jgi:hypothetical protein